MPLMCKVLKDIGMAFKATAKGAAGEVKKKAVSVQLCMQKDLSLLFPNVTDINMKSPRSRRGRKYH